MELLAKLKKREESGNPIKVGIIGCGQMGSGLAHTINNITGMAVSAIADIRSDRGIAVFSEMGYTKDQVKVTENPGEAEDLIRKGQPVVTSDPLLMPRLTGLEANVEATGIPDVGAMTAYQSIMSGKPIIMMNVETDITIGYYLNHLARKMGTIYTVASGDEPGVCAMLYEQAKLMGFQVVALGKGKNNPIDPAITPALCREEAETKGMNPKILSSFIDGTKTMVEMAAVSNATGLVPDTPGMHGPKAELDELVKTFIPREDGGIFTGKGRVDFSTGRIAPGVFAVVYTDDKRIRKDMKFITKENGPYYLHFRPYHLCDLETPQSIAEAVLLKEVTVTAAGRYAEVLCTAKRDLKAGEQVTGIGGPDWRGKIFSRKEALSLDGISIGIGEGGTVKNDIRKGEIFTRNNFKPKPETLVYKLRELQETLPEEVL
jgi:predicted homoserine dehydrogenase-like protein